MYLLLTCMRYFNIILARNELISRSNIVFLKDFEALGLHFIFVSFHSTVACSVPQVHVERMNDE